MADRQNERAFRPELQSTPKGQNERATDSEYLDQNIFDLLEKISPAIWETYSISYHSPSHITLNPLDKNTDFYVISDEENLLNEQKIKNLALIERNMQKQECSYLQRKNLKN